MRCCIASRPAASTIGAHILAVFLLVAGVLLLTGASVAGVLRATGSGLADTTRAISRTVPARPRRAPAADVPPEPVAAPEPYHPPEPADHDVVVRATHVEAPPPAAVKPGRDGFWSGASRFPDIYGEPLPDG